MTILTAFDSKDFKRTNKQGVLKFFSPLGCGVTISNPEKFQKCYLEKLTQLYKELNISPKCGCFASSEYFPSIGYAKTYFAADELLKAVQQYIDSVFISYVILPSTKVPTIDVGYFGSKKEIKTPEFLRITSSYFSYITAFTYWKQQNIENRKNEQILIDGFHGKITRIWEDFADEINPKVYVHGDECNVFISTADMIASLTDKKLYDHHLRLHPDDVKEVWNDYPFEVNVQYLDAKMIPQIKWVSDEHIDTTKYCAKPTVFLKTDAFSSEQIEEFPVYFDATMLAQKLNGSLQGFDKKLDIGKIQDGDIFVYAGKNAEKTAMTLKDMYKITAMSFNEFKEKKNELPLY